MSKKKPLSLVEVFHGKKALITEGDMREDYVQKCQLIKQMLAKTTQQLQYIARADLHEIKELDHRMDIVIEQMRQGVEPDEDPKHFLAEAAKLFSQRGEWRKSALAELAQLEEKAFQQVYRKP